MCLLRDTLTGAVYPAFGDTSVDVVAGRVIAARCSGADAVSRCFGKSGSSEVRPPPWSSCWAGDVAMGRRCVDRGWT